MFAGNSFHLSSNYYLNIVYSQTVNAKTKKGYGADRKSIMRRDSENCMILMASEKNEAKKVVVYQTLNFRCILYTDVLMGQQISSFSMRIL